MDKRILKIGGVAATIVGAIALYLSGIGESAVSAVVGAVFILAGVVAAIFKA